VPCSRRDLLRWQFDLTWSLAELHFEQLRPDDVRWEPTATCWTVRQRPDGTWVPDWQEPEPEPTPVPTIAWVTWHIGWWWTVAIDHARRRTPRKRTEVGWPGADAAVDWLRGLRDDWLAVLDGLTDADLDAMASFPWRDNPERTIAHMVGWVNSELMKNIAELGQLRLLRAARGS